MSQSISDESQVCLFAEGMGIAQQSPSAPYRYSNMPVRRKRENVFFHFGKKDELR
jgi:hypothetical protein